MFTGIIEAVGRIKSISPQGGDVRITIDTGLLDMADVKLGDSIATSGICLTVIAMSKHSFSADVSAETLRRTILGHWKAGTAVNLEKALMPTTRLGGHIVSGHVDGVGKIIEARKDARSLYFAIKAPDALAKYMAHKGSITVDGISLTINELRGAVLSLNLVPHTAAQTTVLNWQVGSEVNLEVDVLARYLERLLLGDKAALHDPESQESQENDGANSTNNSKETQGISLAFLQQNGFA